VYCLRVPLREVVKKKRIGALQRRLRMDGGIVELTVHKSSAWEGPKRVKLKSLYCWKPLPGNGC
jgi:hypothetical protein